MNLALFHISLAGAGSALSPVLLVLALAGSWIAHRAWRTGLATPLDAALVAIVGAIVFALSISVDAWSSADIAITPFGALLTVGFLAGWAALHAFALRHGTAVAASDACYLSVCVSALVGARLFYVVTHWHELTSWSSALSFSHGGLALNGALVAGVVSSWLCFIARPSAWRSWLDALAPALGIALGLGHLGAYLHRRGDSALDLPTASSFAATELYSGAAGLALAAIALGLGSRRRFHGQVFLSLALGYGIVQVSLGLLREAPGIAWLTHASSGLIVATALWGWRAWHKTLTFCSI